MNGRKNNQHEGRLDLNDLKASNYSPNTLISNWFEDLGSLERQLQEFQRKQKNGELKVQRTRKTFYNLFKTLSFDQGDTRIVKFGGLVQIVTPYTYAPNGQAGLTLCGTVTEADIDNYSHFSEHSSVSVSPIRAPYVKNLFRIISPFGSSRASGDYLKYGDEFLIATTGSWSGKPLYVKSDPPRAVRPGNELNHAIVTFGSKQDRYCTWKVIFKDPRLREAMEKQPVPLDTQVIIKQIMTNKSLSAEPKLWHQTFFGLEADVCVHDYKTPKNVDSPNSIWVFASKEK